MSSASTIFEYNDYYECGSFALFKLWNKFKSSSSNTFSWLITLKLQPKTVARAHLSSANAQKIIRIKEFIFRQIESTGNEIRSWSKCQEASFKSLMKKKIIFISTWRWSDFFLLLLLSELKSSPMKIMIPSMVSKPWKAIIYFTQERRLNDSLFPHWGNYNSLKNKIKRK